MTDQPESAAPAPAPPISSTSPFPLFAFAAIFLFGVAMILAGIGMILAASGGMDGAMDTLSRTAEKLKNSGPSSESSFAESRSEGAIAPKMKELMSDLAYRLEDAYDRQAILGHENNVQRAPETRALADHPDVLKMIIGFDVPHEGIGVLWQREAVVPLTGISRTNTWRQSGELRFKDETYLGGDRTRQPLRMFILEREVKNTGVRLKIQVFASRD